MTYKYKITVVIYDKENPLDERFLPRLLMNRQAVLTTPTLEFSNPVNKGDVITLTETPYFGISAENIIHGTDFSEIQVYKWRGHDPNSFKEVSQRFRSGLEKLSKAKLERDEIVQL